MRFAIRLLDLIGYTPAMQSGQTTWKQFPDLFRPHLGKVHVPVHPSPRAAPPPPPPQGPDGPRAQHRSYMALNSAGGTRICTSTHTTIWSKHTQYCSANRHFTPVQIFFQAFDHFWFFLGTFSQTIISLKLRGTMSLVDRSSGTYRILPAVQCGAAAARPREYQGGFCSHGDLYCQSSLSISWVIQRSILCYAFMYDLRNERLNCWGIALALMRPGLPT